VPRPAKTLAPLAGRGQGEGESAVGTHLRVRPSERIGRGRREEAERKWSLPYFALYVGFKMERHLSHKGTAYNGSPRDPPLA